jgi:hypothetical protein
MWRVAVVKFCSELRLWTGSGSLLYDGEIIAQDYMHKKDFFNARSVGSAGPNHDA